MSAADMLEDEFPHGTIKGYRQGCKTGHCPAPITCSQVRTRYASDYGFRKRVDAGWTVAELAAKDAADAAAIRDAEKAARAAANRARQAAAAKARRKSAPRKPSAASTLKMWTPAEEAQFRDLHAEGLNDVQIAQRMDRTPASIKAKRDGLGLKGNRKPATHGTQGGYGAGCRGDDCPATPSCQEVARAAWRASAEAKRRRDGAPVHKARTTCRRGHELTPDNIHVKKDGRRRCETCRVAQYQAHNARRSTKAKAAA